MLGGCRNGVRPGYIYIEWEGGSWDCCVLEGREDLAVVICRGILSVFRYANVTASVKIH